MNRDILRQFAVIFTTLFTLVANGAANALPLNGRNTGVISDSFNVLFVPAGYVFSIWGVIYLFLGAYTVYHSLPAQRQNPRLRGTGWLVALSSIANGSWIFFWHYAVASYLASLAAMLVLLATLVAIYLRLDIGRTAFKGIERWVVAMPFSIYLGWITVATIANITAVAAYLGWRGAPLSETAWTVIILAAGVIVGGLMAFTRRDIAYLLVLVWAFVGISVRWANMDVLSVAGYAAAALVVLALVVGRIGRLRTMAAPVKV